MCTHIYTHKPKCTYRHVHTTHAHTDTYRHTHVPTLMQTWRTHRHMHTCTDTCTNIHMHIDPPTYTHTLPSTCTLVYKYTRIHNTYTDTCTHSHTYTHWHMCTHTYTHPYLVKLKIGSYFQDINASFLPQCYRVGGNLAFSILTFILVALARTLASRGRKKTPSGLIQSLPYRKDARPQGNHAGCWAQQFPSVHQCRAVAGSLGWCSNLEEKAGRRVNLDETGWALEEIFGELRIWECFSYVHKFSSLIRSVCLQLRAYLPPWWHHTLVSSAAAASAMLAADISCIFQAGTEGWTWVGHLFSSSLLTKDFVVCAQQTGFENRGIR